MNKNINDKHAKEQKNKHVLIVPNEHKIKPFNWWLIVRFDNNNDDVDDDTHEYRHVCRLRQEQPVTTMHKAQQSIESQTFFSDVAFLFIKIYIYS